MNFDDAPPFPLSEYRKMQRLIPGVDGLYLLLRAVMESKVDNGGSILLAGAGGGREIETLAPSDQGFRFTAIDPSGGMLNLAREVAENSNALERTIFCKGHVSDSPLNLHDAATSILVMHFLPDDGTKLDYLRSIHQRLRHDAIYFHVDVAIEDPAELESLREAYLRQAELAGLERDKANIAPKIIDKMPIVSRSRVHDLLTDSGFKNVRQVFQGLWYCGWVGQAGNPADSTKKDEPRLEYA